MALIGHRRFKARVEEKEICDSLKECRPVFETNSDGWVTGIAVQGLPPERLLPFLVHLKFLQVLCFESLVDEPGEPVRPSFLERLSQLPNLKKLQICNHPILLDSFSLLESLGLEHLRVRGCEITDQHIDRIFDLTQLQSLTIVNNPRVSFAKVEELLSLRLLNSLVLTFDAFSQNARFELESLGQSNGCQLMYCKTDEVKVRNYLGNGLPKE